MKGYTYILLSEKDSRTYVGSTSNLERRIQEHNTGKCRSTKYRMPFQLVHSEEYDNLSEARKRESFLKTKAGRKELRELFKKLTLPGSQAVRQ